MKKLALLVLAAVMLLMCVPLSTAALSNDDAIAYYGICRNLLSRDGIYYNSSTHLIDFDGDGSEELLILYGDFDDFYEMNYEVYSGEKLIAQDRFEGTLTYPALYTKARTNKTYLVAEAAYGDLGGTIFYTIDNGSWVMENNLSIAWIGAIESICHINGVEVSREEYDNVFSAYRRHKDLGEKNSVEGQLLNSIDLSISNYNDVLPTLSQDEKTALFNDFLCLFSGYDVDYRTASDYMLLEEILPTVWVESYDGLGLEIGYGNPPYGNVSKQELDKLTSSIYGRVFDGNDFKYENMPPDEQIGDGYFFWLDGEWRYQYGGGRGIGGGDGYPRHLYDIGNGYYYAVQEVVWFNSGGEEYDKSLYAYIIKQNDDGSYRLIRTYPAGHILTKADLDAFVNPSDWAKGELAAAEKAELVPELDGDPFMTESATRLQFAQLAVNLAEKVTGKKLDAAPAATFSDCSDVSVLKAYKAGIINGTSATEFSPYARLTREQLATMIWRTVKYIQDETGKEKLTDGGEISGYTDASDVSDYALEAVSALAKNDIMKGTSETELSPKGNCSVEQSIILIYRTYQKIK